MRDRLAHGEAHLVTVERALEQHVDEVGRRRLAVGRAQDEVEPLVMVMRQLVEPAVDVAERAPVRRQNQRIGIEQLGEAPAASRGTGRAGRPRARSATR